MIGVVNNIMIPLFASTVLSPKCFKGIFNPPDEIKSSYTNEICIYVDIITNECGKNEIGNFFTKFSAPFYYSYQCSSSIAQTYASIYIIMAVFLVITGPLSIIFLIIIVIH